MYFKTGIKSFDNVYGGLRSGLMYLISGEEKSGKTSLALQIACIASRDNVGTYLLDCGGHIHYLRLSRIAANWEADLSKIKITFPRSFKEQERLIVWLADSAPAGSLVIVDDFTYLHRVQMVGDVNMDKGLFHSLAFQMACLKEACKTRNLTSILITDVHDVPPKGISTPVASAITTYFADVHLSLFSDTSGLKILRVISGLPTREYKIRTCDGGVIEA